MPLESRIPHQNQKKQPKKAEFACDEQASGIENKDFIYPGNNRHNNVCIRLDLSVAYGDISPNTGPGQFLAALVMILGYSIIAVPTGIVTVELSQAYTDKSTSQACPNCSAKGHDRDAQYCKFCGAKL